MKMKLVLFAISAAALAVPANSIAMEQEKKNSNLATASLSFLGGAYGTRYAGIAAHELGHVAADKMCHKKCKSLIYVNPYLSNGWCLAYNGSLTFDQKLSFIDLINKAREGKSTDVAKFIMKHNIKLLDVPKGLKGAGVYGAGPFAGFSCCAILPFLNTVGNEYLKCGSLPEAIRKARQKNYLNSDQNLGILFGCATSGLSNFLNLFPLEKGTDGSRMLESLKLYKPAIRYSVIGAPYVGLAFLGYNLLSNK